VHPRPANEAMVDMVRASSPSNARVRFTCCSELGRAKPHFVEQFESNPSTRVDLTRPPVDGSRDLVFLAPRWPSPGLHLYVILSSLSLPTIRGGLRSQVVNRRNT